MDITHHKYTIHILSKKEECLKYRHLHDEFGLLFSKLVSSFYIFFNTHEIQKRHNLVRCDTETWEPLATNPATDTPSTPIEMDSSVPPIRLPPYRWVHFLCKPSCKPRFFNTQISKVRSSSWQSFVGSPSPLDRSLTCCCCLLQVPLVVAERFVRLFVTIRRPIRSRGKGECIQNTFHTPHLKRTQPNGGRPHFRRPQS